MMEEWKFYLHNQFRTLGQKHGQTGSDVKTKTNEIRVKWYAWFKDINNGIDVLNYYALRLFDVKTLTSASIGHTHIFSTYVVKYNMFVY